MIYILPIDAQFLLQTYRDTLLYNLLIVAYDIFYDGSYKSPVDVVLQLLLTIIL